MKLKDCFEVRVRYQTFNQQEFDTLKQKIKELFVNKFSFSSVRLPVKKKRVTLLRSPHVNKKSRDQLEVRLYNGVVFVRTTSFHPVLLEALKNLSVPQMSLKISITNL
jgi:small subunit ribosomal protein S10